jgi:hypothetical protein
MPRPAKALPIYQKKGRWYVDLRRYQDVGGERTALMVPGEPKKAGHGSAHGRIASAGPDRAL